jgi:WD40 repeat protein
MYGHLSRIWKVQEVSGNRLATASEDSTVRIWDQSSG